MGGFECSVIVVVLFCGVVKDFGMGEELVFVFGDDWYCVLEMSFVDGVEFGEV